MKIAICLSSILILTTSVAAEDLGGGGPASHGLVPQLIADNWIPGRALTLHLKNLPPSASSGLVVIGTAPGNVSLPGNVGTLMVSFAHPFFLLPVGIQTPLLTIPPALEGSTFFIQALIFDAGHASGGVLTDATRVDIFTPMILEANTRQSSNNLKVIDMATFSVIQTLSNYRGGSYNFTPDHKSVYVCECEMNLTRLAWYTIQNGLLTFQKYIPLSGAARYHGDITRDGKLYYVPLHDGIAVLDVDPNSPGFQTEIKKLPVSFTGNTSTIFTGPMDCTLTPDGKKLYVAYGETITWPGNSHIGVFDLSMINPTEKLIQVTTGGVVTLGGDLATRSSIESSANGRYVAAVEFGFSPGLFSKGFQNGALVNVIDTLTDTEIAAVKTFGYSQDHVAFDRMGRNLYVAQTDINGNGEVIRVDADHRHMQPYTIIKKYTFSTQPYSATCGPRAVDSTPDGSEIYVTVVEDNNHPTPSCFRIDTWQDKITGGPLTVASLPANIRIQQR